MYKTIKVFTFQIASFDLTSSAVCPVEDRVVSLVHMFDEMQLCCATGAGNIFTVDNQLEQVRLFSQIYLYFCFYLAVPQKYFFLSPIFMCMAFAVTASVIL